MPAPVVDAEAVALYEFGKEVYYAKCSNCHDPLDISTKQGRTQDDIRNSLTNIRAMRNVVLSEAEIEAVYFVLNHGDPRNVEPEEPDEPQDGADIFAQQCASCHGEDARPRFPLFVVNTDQESIANKTALTMPPGRPDLCVDECAELVAEFIVSSYEGTESAAAKLENLGTQRLKRDHYFRTVDFLVGRYGIDVSSLSHPADPSIGGFDAGSQVDASLVFAYHLNAGAVAKQFVEAVERNNNLIGCNNLGNNCVRNFSRSFAELAYRRPLVPAQREAVDAAYAAGGNPLNGLGNVVGFVLQSASFLYYLDPVDDNSDYTLANSLSYLLWSEPPDEELLTLAGQNQLRNPARFDEQVDRLLADERGVRTLMDFVDQWLTLDRVPNIFKDQVEVPGFSADVAATMNQDVMAFLAESLQQENSFRYLFSADYQLSNRLVSALRTFSNNVQASRSGILSQPGVLAFLAGPVDHSPILRGSFIEDKLLCIHREPADGIDDVVANTVIPEDATPRVVTELLTSSASCQTCHASINAFGFGFEDFDGLGLPTGAGTLESFVLPASDSGDSATLNFNGIGQLQQALLQTDQLHNCGVDKAWQYANFIDRPSTASSEAIYDQFRQSADFKTLFKAIALTLLENND